MRIRIFAASLGGALLIALAGMPPAAANLDEEPVDIDRHEFADNNATDSGRADRQARLLYYRSQPLLLRYLMSTIEGRIVLYRTWLFRQMYGWPNPQPQTQPAPMQEPQPGDLPAESIFDEIDDNEPLPMVGEPGSGTALKAFDEIGGSEPPLVSILDQIDESPKPAVNQAVPPQIVETKQWEGIVKRGLKLLPIAATLMAAASASTVSANMPPDLHDDEPEVKEEKKGGNAIDKTTAASTARPMTGAGSLPPEAYGLMGEFWGSMLVGDYAGAAWAIADSPEAPPEADFSYLAPTDGPAESVLDQLDESHTPLPMVGEPGSEVAVAPEAPTPPSESILDYLDSAPAPQPAVSTTQEASKPAVDQASKPAVVEAAPQ